MRDADFIDTIGVNTHFGSDPYNNALEMQSLLAYLGTENVRQTSPLGASDTATMQALGALGAKIDLIVNGGGPVNLAGALGAVDSLAPYLNAVEGPNEVLNYPLSYNGQTGLQAAAAIQKDLYAAVKSNPLTAKDAVYMFTIGGGDPGIASVGDLSAYADDANIHSYPPHGLRPIFVIHAAISGGQVDAPSDPVVVTETGFYTLPQSDAWGGVPQAVQASYLTDELLDEAAAGVQRTYIYDLIDDGTDQTSREDNFGLFTNDGAPKLAATAIHNLTTLLADPGVAARTFTPAAFDFTATGVPYDYTGNTLLLQKSDGTNVIAVWNEEELWNPDTQTATAPQHFAVTVTLPRTYATVLVFDPTIGTAPIATLNNVSSVNLDLTDHPLLIEMPAPAAATPPPVAPPPVAPPVLPPAQPLAQNIVLHISEDAYQGDAQFVVRVDGAQVGGTQTATASHAAGQSQTFTIAGALGTGPHSVAVQFLNDAYGYSSSNDRNLYVDGIDSGGVAQSGDAAPLYSNGSVAFTTPGDDTLVTFNLSEDAYQGDAIADVTVDGKIVGGPVTVTVSHALGLTQAVSFMVPLSPGAHLVGAIFTNDAYGGKPSLDRNLYLNSVDVAGQHYAANLTLYSPGSQSLALPIGPATGVAGALTITSGGVAPFAPASIGGSPQTGL